MNLSGDSLLTLGANCASGHVKMQGLWSQSVLLVLLTGGAKPLVKSVALAEPNGSGNGNSSDRSHSALKTLFGTGKDTVAHWAAQLLAGQYRCPVMVTEAIHADSATPQNELTKAMQKLVLDWSRRFPTPPTYDLQEKVE